jgi:acyl-coenzyme A thioesterase PaaI-like protein
MLGLGLRQAIRFGKTRVGIKIGRLTTVVRDSLRPELFDNRMVALVRARHPLLEGGWVTSLADDAGGIIVA